MKITRKEFINAMVENLSIFAGVVRGAFDLEYTKETIREQVDKIRRDGIVVEKRSAVARSHDLVFSGGSHLELDKREFEKLDCGNCVMYICREHGLDSWGDEYDKRMVYVVE